MNLAMVRIRHHKTECVIKTKTAHCRISIINCDSDSDSESNSDKGRVQRQNAIANSSLSGGESSTDGSSSSNPFGYIRYYNPQTGSKTDIETKYESFIDYGEPISKPQIVSDVPKKPSLVLTSTAKLELLHKQPSESSDASSCIVPKPFGACEDLVNLDGNMVNDIPEGYVPLVRQSCPMKMVGNKFSSNSLTTIYIPTWSNSDNNISCNMNFEDKIDTSSTTTHSSSLELPMTMPLPDNMVAELLYNFEGENSPSEKTVRLVGMRSLHDRRRFYWCT